MDENLLKTGIAVITIQLAWGVISKLIEYFGKDKETNNTTLSDQLKANQEHMKEMLQAWIRKDEIKSNEVDRLMHKLDKVVDSINNLARELITNSVENDHMKKSIEDKLSNVLLAINAVYEKVDKSSSHIHDRINKVNDNVAVILSNTDRCIKPEKEGMVQSDIEKMIEDRRG